MLAFEESEINGLITLFNSQRTFFPSVMLQNSLNSLKYLYFFICMKSHCHIIC